MSADLMLCLAVGFACGWLCDRRERGAKIRITAVSAVAVAGMLVLAWAMCALAGIVWELVR